MIFFELHEVVDEGQSGFRSREEKFYVLAYFVSATPEQIRGASDLNPLHEVRLLLQQMIGLKCDCLFRHESELRSRIIRI